MLFNDTLSTVYVLQIIKDVKMLMVMQQVRIWEVTTKSKACLTTVQVLC